MNWFDINYENMNLEDNGLSYLLRRGAKEELIEKYKIKQWDHKKVSVNLPDDFCKSFGFNGKYLDGYLIFPFISFMDGKTIGFEARNIIEKRLCKYTFKEYKKVEPVFFGLTPETFTDIWGGKDICLTEGIFDAFALTWCTNKIILSSLTANLSNLQFKFLKRYISNKNTVYIVYDNDKVGEESSDKLAKLFNYVKVKNKIIRYNILKDPGEIWDQYGEEGLKKHLGKFLEI
jgi:DNA primase